MHTVLEEKHMPFDGTDFPERRNPPRRPAGSDTAATLIIAAVAFGLLVMPISLSALVDIVRYVRGY